MKFLLENATWQLAKEIGYEPKTTLWEDFSIADEFGLVAIKDTYKRAFEFAKNNYIYLTELVMVLNHKIWFWYDKDGEKARLYNDLWAMADSHAMDNLKDDELTYFLNITD